MSLSCSCNYDDDAPWYWWPPKDYSVFNRRIGKRCCCKDCETIIHSGDICGEVRRTRPGTDWEHDKGIAYYDDPEAVPIANAYMCEKCTDLYFSFDDLGFECVSPYESMIELAAEYHENFYGMVD